MLSFQLRLMFVSAALCGTARGQTLPTQSANSSRAVTVRELSAPEAKSRVALGAILGVRQLPGGALLVNDGGNRQLLLFDETLSTKTVVIDSAAASGEGYGPGPTPFIAYRSDTTLFVDGKSATLTVIGPAGAVVRVVAPPKPGDLNFLAAYPSGADGNGNLIYRAVLQPATGLAAPNPILAAAQRPDSAPIVRASFETRVVDTLARLKVAGNVRAMMETGVNSTVIVVTINPLLTVDDWAVLADGTLAIVRGHDYHVDLVHSDGTMQSGPKLPFDWKKLSDDDKQQLLDSLHAANEKEARATPNSLSVPSAEAPGRLRVRQGGTTTFQRKEVPIGEVTDYYPPIRYGAAKADADGNLWILPTTSAQANAGELVYDVVNKLGDISHRVRLPVARSVAGFGKGGVVYLMGRHDDKTWFIERTRVKQ